MDVDYQTVLRQFNDIVYYCLDENEIKEYEKQIKNIRKELKDK